MRKKAGQAIEHCAIVDEREEWMGNGRGKIKRMGEAMEERWRMCIAILQWKIGRLSIR